MGGRAVLRMSENWKIRPALPADAAATAPLIALSMAGFGEAVLGLNDRPRLLRALEHFFRLPGSRFSHDCSFMAEMDGQVVGVLVAFPYAEMNARNLRMAGQFPGAYALSEMVKIVWLSLPMLRLPEVQRGEFYTANLAVDPTWQGHGVGAALLNHAERLAADNGLAVCSLNVDLDNPRAKALYQRQGYQTTRTIATPALKASHHSRGYEHMVKHLNIR